MKPRVIGSLIVTVLTVLIGSAANGFEGFEAGHEQDKVAVAGNSTTKNDQVDEFLLALMKQRDIPGLQVAVVHQGQIVKASSYGIANLQDSVSVDDETLFTINSMTKAFTGVTVMQLVEHDKLRLTDGVSKFIPELRAA